MKICHLPYSGPKCTREDADFLVCLYVMHKKPDPSMKITVEQSNNNGNDQWRKDNMTYILPGEGGAHIITILSSFC